MRKQKSWNLFHPLSPWHSLGCAKTLLAHDQGRWVCHSSLPGEQWWLKLQPQNWHKDRLQPEPPAGDDYSGRRHRCGACWTWTHNLKGWRHRLTLYSFVALKAWYTELLISQIDPWTAFPEDFTTFGESQESQCLSTQLLWALPLPRGKFTWPALITYPKGRPLLQSSGLLFSQLKIQRQYWVLKRPQWWNNIRNIGIFVVNVYHAKIWQSFHV